ncbi:MAG: hypothetical protein ABSD49_13050 [Candidatus Bathyarchaeia archaeon]
MSEYQESYYPEEERKRRRRFSQMPTLEERARAHEILSRAEESGVDILAKEQKIKDRMKSAHLARMSNDVVERGQHMVAAGLAKVFHYEYYKHWSLYEMKKGIFSRKERHEDEETRESVYMEANDDES